MNYIDEYVYISKYAGMREDLVQAGGGNSSVKLDDNRMLIKSSGFQLADINQESGYSEINYKEIVDFFENTPMEEITQECEKELLDKSLIKGGRPSIETFLHSITDKFTLHTHPLLINVLLCRKGGIDILKEMFPNALFVGYETPGIKLAKKYFQTCNENKEKNRNIIFLQNHGVIISADNAQDVVKVAEYVNSKIEKYLNVNMDAYKNSTHIFEELTKLDNNKDIVYLSNDMNINKLVNNEKLNYWFCPDCLVYCGKRPLILKNNFTVKDIEKHIIEFGKPVVIYYENRIYISASTVKKAKEIESVLSFSVQVLEMNKEYEINLLDENEQNFLLNWDSEKYRQNLK